MEMDKTIESLTGVTKEGKKSKIPARLDFWQSATGLFLALFMVGHLFLVSSILLGKEAMYTITKFFEGEFIFGEAKPEIVSGVAFVVFVVFIAHAFLALRKFPINYMQFIKYRSHMKMMKHSDTNLWFYQVVTGFIMFFFGSVHIYIMMTQPSTIGPYGSAERFVADSMWPLYLILLFAVEIHGSIGLYRLAVKWGWFDGKDPRKTRTNLKRLKWAMSIFFITLGLASFAAYVKIGLENIDKPGIRYKPDNYKSDAQPIKNFYNKKELASLSAINSNRAGNTLPSDELMKVSEPYAEYHEKELASLSAINNKESIV